MLRVGLSGGIGSGKSTVARRLQEHGAVLIDADQLAREVVAPGTPGLAEIVERFGPEVLDEHGALNRPELARRVFDDEAARADLNAITHPRIAELTAQRMARAPEDAIVVHDIPLLVEAGYAPNYHLVIIVDAPVETRVQRLVERGLQEEDARARIRAQATEEQRRAVADVWLDNSGSMAELLAAVDRLWNDRLLPFERNVRARRPALRSGLPRVPADPSWPRQAQRLMARIQKAAGDLAVRVDHVGPTSLPDQSAEDIIDLQLSVRSMEDADALAQPLAEAGFPPIPEVTADRPMGGDTDLEQWEKRLHSSADPGRPAHVHIRAVDRSNWRFGLLLFDWLREDEQARAEYARETADGAEVEWLSQAVPRAEQWATRTGWRP